MGSRETHSNLYMHAPAYDLQPLESQVERLDVDALRIIGAIQKHIQRFDTDPTHQLMERLADIPLAPDTGTVPSDVQVQEYLHTLPEVVYTPDTKSTREFSQDHWWLTRRHGVARVTRTAMRMPVQSGIIYCLAASRPIEMPGLHESS